MIHDAVAQLQACESATDRRQSILIVDDDRSQVEALSLRLQRQGFTTMFAHEGRRGVHLARERCPDLVLLDLRLPDVDGFEVCGELVDSPETCHIPIIIVSGLDQPDVVRSAGRLGASILLASPTIPTSCSRSFSTPCDATSTIG